MEEQVRKPAHLPTALGAGGGGGAGSPPGDQTGIGGDGQPYRAGGGGGDGFCTNILGTDVTCYGGGGQAQVYRIWAGDCLLAVAGPENFL